MKNNQNKCVQALQLLLEINYLREDSYLFSKIALLQSQKKIRSQYNMELFKIQQQRIQIQDKIISLFQNLQINDFWKSNLFQFSNKIYKNIKNYHQKLMTCSLKLSEMVDTNQFLQSFRVLSIDKLSQKKELCLFLRQLIIKIRQRYHKQIIQISSTFHINKIIEFIRGDELNKNNKYLNLIKQQNPRLFFNCHKQILMEYDQQIEKLLKKQNSKPKFNRYQLYGEILDLQDHNIIQNHYIMANSIVINLNYKQQGFCQFIISKFYRILKDLKSKNMLNEKQILNFIEKYKNWKIRAKQNCLKPKYYLNNLEKVSKFSMKAEIIEKNSTKQEFGVVSTLEIKNNTFFTQNILAKTDLNISEFSTQFPSNKKPNLFKIQKMESKKKSNTLRPLEESKQNNKQIIHQKIIEMKLQEEPLHLTKILRIKRKRPFHGVRQENVFGHIIKENNLNKFSFLLT